MSCACYSRCELDSSMCSTVGGVYQYTRDLLQLEAVTSVTLVRWREFSLSLYGTTIYVHTQTGTMLTSLGGESDGASKLDLISLTSSNLLRGIMNPPLIIRATPRDISMGRWQPCASNRFPLTPRCTRVL